MIVIDVRREKDYAIIRWTTYRMKTYINDNNFTISLQNCAFVKPHV